MLNSVIGSFNLPAGTGSQSISGLGFSPKIVLFWSSTGVTADGSSATFNLSFGVGLSSSNRRCIRLRSGDGLAATVVDGWQRQDCVILGGGVGGPNTKTDLTSMDSSGFTLTTSLNAGNFNALVYYLALGGNDLSGVASGSTTLPTSPGTTSITGLGFQPTCVILFASTITITDPENAEQSTGGFIGWMAAGGTQSYTSSYSKDAVSTSVTASGNQTTAIATLITGTTVSAQAVLQSFDAGGFTLNWTTTTGAADVVYYIALAGPSFESGTFAQPSSNGNQTISGLTNVGGNAFTPSVVLFKGSSSAAGIPASGSALMFGAADNSGHELCVWNGDANGLTTTNASTNIDHTACIKNMTVGHASPTLNSSAVYTGASGNNFNVNWTATDATARITQFLAIGPVPASPGQPWCM
jgi:hypothetical protein